MFSLKAPVGVKIYLSDKCRHLTFNQWEEVLAKLTPYVNEYKIYDWESLFSVTSDKEETDSEAFFFNVLKLLDDSEKFYHLIIENPGTFRNCDNFLAQLRQHPCFGSLMVNVPSWSEDEYKSVTGKDDFSQMVDFVEKAVNSGIEVNTVTKILEGNYCSIQDIAEIGSEKGINYAVFERDVSLLDKSGQCSNKSELMQPASFEHLGQSLNVFKEMRDLGYKVALGNCIPNCFVDTSSYGCMAGILSSCVDSNGNLKPCAFSKTVSGNLLDSDLVTLWRNIHMEKWRELLPDSCQCCAKLTYCPAGCRAFMESSSFKADPLITSPIDTEETELLEVTLEEELCPVPCYTVRQEDFGWALIKGSQVIPVLHKAGPVLLKFDGKNSLASIEDELGGDALAFIYSLYVRGFVELVEPKN